MFPGTYLANWVTARSAASHATLWDPSWPASRRAQAHPVKGMIDAYNKAAMHTAAMSVGDSIPPMRRRSMLFAKNQTKYPVNSVALRTPAIRQIRITGVAPG